MKKTRQGCDLASCMLCRLCRREWIPAVSAHRRNFTLKKGEALFREGEPVTGLYFVYEGRVKVHKRWGKEKELIVRFAQKGDIVGHRGMGQELVYPVSATALEPVTLCYVDMTFFQSSLQVNHTLLYELMLFYARELQESEKNMRNLAHMPVKGRVANALLQLRARFGFNGSGVLNMTLSRQDLAAYTGAAYETVFRIMGELAQERIIAVNGREITIICPEKLLRLAKEEAP